MILTLKRVLFKDNFTISDLKIDGKNFCHVLEDVDRNLDSSMSLEEIKAKKVYGKTAIPTGTYELVINYSNKFKTYLPLLLNVPGYSGIRIHPGTTEQDTEGCLLPGVFKSDRVMSSRVTFRDLMTILRRASKKERIFVQVER
ncbi:hypothetical protein EKK58_05955 [Candidatus Dependentiae bacterium]|nr:MAG: hypothetical protein EKK58_05955 [Candidatus Dependentiae bacterium]